MSHRRITRYFYGENRSAMAYDKPFIKKLESLLGHINTC